LTLQLGKRVIAAVAWIHVNDDDPARCARRQPNVCVRPLLPPRLDLHLVCARRVETALHPGMLAGLAPTRLAARTASRANRVKGKDGPPTCSVRQRGFFQGRGEAIVLNS